MLIIYCFCLSESTESFSSVNISAGRSVHAILTLTGHHVYYKIIILRSPYSVRHKISVAMVQLTLKLAIIVALFSELNSRKIRNRTGRVTGDDEVSG